MSYQEFNIRCQCGGSVSVDRMFLMSSKAIMFDGICSECGSPVRAVYTLTDMYKHCPVASVKKLSEAIGQTIDTIANQVDFETEFNREFSWMRISV